MTNRTPIQTAQAEFPPKVFPGRQRKRHQNTNLVCTHCQSINHRNTKENQAQMGFLEPR